MVLVAYHNVNIIEKGESKILKIIYFIFEYGTINNVNLIYLKQKLYIIFY